MQITNKKIQTLILINLVVLLTLPQLNNVHYDPLPQFWAEITFVWAAISLFGLVCLSVDKITIPKVIIPLMLFSILLLLQPLMVQIDFFGFSITTILEMFICILVAISTNLICDRLGLQTFLIYLSYALIIGAVLQSLIGFLQYSGLYRHFGDVIFYDGAHPRTNIFGHFGQRNHYCHYLMWAIFGLIYLFQIKRIKASNFYLIIIWLLFSLTIASSRSVFIYFTLAIAISSIYYLKTKEKSAKQLSYILIITFLTLLLFEYSIPIIHKLLSMHDQSGLQRLVDPGSTDITGRRLIEWKKAWIVFKQYPIFGYGFNEYAKQSVYLQLLFPNSPADDGLFTNCHNLILQLLAETGITGTLIIVFSIIYLIYAILKNRSSLESLIIICMLSTTLTHSMLEYPLWYIYFLGPFIMFLSIDKPLMKLNRNFALTFFAIPIIIIVYLMVNSSIIFNKLVAYSDIPNKESSILNNAKYLENLSQNILWSYPALFSLDDYIDVTESKTDKIMTKNQQFAYESKFTNFHPYPDNLIKLAILNWEFGNYDEARKLVKLAAIAFPVYKKDFASTLKKKNYSELITELRAKK